MAISRSFYKSKTHYEPISIALLPVPNGPSDGPSVLAGKISHPKVFFVVALAKHYLTIFAVNGATVAADCRLSKAVSLLTDIGCIRLFETSRDHDWRTRLRDLTLRWYGSFKIFQKMFSKLLLFRKQTDRTCFIVERKRSLERWCLAKLPSSR